MRLIDAGRNNIPSGEDNSSKELRGTVHTREIHSFILSMPSNLHKLKSLFYKFDKS